MTRVCVHFVVNFNTKSDRITFVIEYDYCYTQPRLAESASLDFAEYRVDYLSSFIVNEFGLEGTYALTVTISDTKAGSVILNSLILSDSEWLGNYFAGVPVTLSAQPKEGYIFSHWLGNSDSTAATITLTSAEAVTLEAVFITEK